MSSIFVHRDNDGDELDVHRSPETLIVHSIREHDGELTSVGLDREAVSRLYDALGEWLYSTGVPLPDHSLIEQLIRRAAEDAVVTVLPLNLRPDVQSRYVDAGTASCVIPGCKLFPGMTQHFEHDPEPREVGHPGPTWDDKLWGASASSVVVPKQLVGCECGHPGALHSYDDALGCTYTRCECMRVRP